MNIRTVFESLNHLCPSLAPWRSQYFPQDIEAFFELRSDLAQRLERFSAEEQTLSIGIIGQVKAGKSSFLNALLFDGRPVLPEAATPKTANLTRIIYGETPMLQVNYYSQDEWASMLASAKSESDQVEARVARDLVAMVRQHGVDAAPILARGCDTLPTENIDDLIGLLNDYTGENGRFTGLVKSTELHLPLEELKGFEVVDTPGMNDPVPSRTQHTREYLAKCDVVFFLSRCSQFLDQSDMDLLALQLPGKGVKHMELVACQFDSAILDDGYDRDSLLQTETNIKTRLGRRAAEEMEKLAELREQLGHADTAALLRRLKLPIFASTFAHGFSAWPQANWGGSMLHVYQQFNDMAAQCWQTSFTKDDWERIGNFPTLVEAYKQAREDKQQLLELQRQSLEPDARRNLHDLLQTLISDVQLRMSMLRDGSLKELEAQQTVVEQRISRIADKLQTEIGQSSSQAAQTCRKMSDDLQTAIAGFARLGTHSGTESETRSCEVSDSSWYNPFSWGRTRTVYYTTTRSYEFLAAADAIEQIVSYYNENKVRLIRAFSSVINPQQLQVDLRRTLLKELDTSNTNFDPVHFRRVFETSLRGLQLPTLQLEMKQDITAGLAKTFQGEVRNSTDMAQLRLGLQQALESVSRQLLQEFAAGVDRLKDSLEKVGSGLHEALSSGLREDLQQVRAAFADKENELRNYGEILNIAETY
jgi:hypothetical protein